VNVLRIGLVDHRNQLQMRILPWTFLLTEVQGLLGGRELYIKRVSWKRIEPTMHIQLLDFNLNKLTTVKMILVACILFISTAYAYPTDAVLGSLSPHLHKRSPCDGKDGEPILYHDYKNDVCPPPNVFDSPGQCHMKKELES
jgi:hypothetical protein